MPYKNRKDNLDYQRRRREEARRVVDSWFNQGCVDCGNVDKRVLEADHVRGKKRFSIGNALRFGPEQIREELKKCEPRCANCHAIRHFEEKEMAKSNGTAASQAHAPESMPYLTDQKHARDYPGKKGGKKESVAQATNDDGALARGRGQVMGTSKGGSHLSLPSSYEVIGHDGHNVTKEAGITSPGQAESLKNDQGKVGAGRQNSLGVSANGSHKGIPTSHEQVGHPRKK